LAAHRKVLTYRWPEDQNLAQELSTVLSPDGRLLVASSGGTYIEVVEVDTGRRLWGRDFGGEGIVRATFSPDSSQVVATYGWFHPSGSGVSDPETAELLGVHMVDAANGETVHHHLVGPRCGVVSRPEAMAVVGDAAASFLLVELGRDANCNQRGDRPERTNASDRNPHHPSMVDLISGKTTQLSEVRSWSGGPPTAVASADGRIIVAIPDGKGLPVIDRATGETIASLDGWPLGISADGSVVMTWDDAGTDIWDLTNGQPEGPILTIESGEEFPWLSPNGLVMVESTDSWISIRDVRTGDEVDRLLTGLGSEGVLSFSGDGSRIAIPEAFGSTAVVFDLIDAAEVSSNVVCDAVGGLEPRFGWIEAAGGAMSVRGQCLGDWFPTQTLIETGSGQIRAVLDTTTGLRSAFTEDGGVFAAQRRAEQFQGAIQLYDSLTGEVLATMKGICDSIGDSGNECSDFPTQPFPDWAYDLDFSPDGSLLAMASEMNDAVLVWDVPTGEMVEILQVEHKTGGPDRALNVEFSPDGTSIAASFVWSPAELWLFSTDDWAPITQHRAPQGAGSVEAPSENLLFTPDGGTLIATDYADAGEGRIVFMDAGGLEPFYEISDAHDGGIVQMDLNEDGTLLASAGLDGFVRVWDVETRALVHQIPVSRDGTGLGGVAFVGDGRHVAVTHPDTGEVRVVTIDTDELFDIARTKLTRGFTDTECATYRIDPCPTLEEIRAG
jgi:WD40 repeat protein